jgi:UDP-N-acetylglucosamine acyltransferase
MEGAHISHDTKVGNNCVFGYGTKIAGDCNIQDGVIFSSSVIENAKTRVGRGAMIQAGTTFSKDVPPYIICSKRSEYGGVNFTMGRSYGVDEKVLKHIANAYRLVYLSNTSLFDAIQQIKELVPDSEEIRNITSFMESTTLGVIGKK